VQASIIRGVRHAAPIKESHTGKEVAIVVQPRGCIDNGDTPALVIALHEVRPFRAASGDDTLGACVIRWKDDRISDAIIRAHSKIQIEEIGGATDTGLGTMAARIIMMILIG